MMQKYNSEIVKRLRRLKRKLSKKNIKSTVVEFKFDGELFTFRGASVVDDILRRLHDGKTFYELEILNFVKNRRSMNDNSVCFDVGANIGNHAIFFARVCKVPRVYAFECNQKTIKLLSENILKNDCCGCVEIVPAAVTTDQVAYVHETDEHNVGMTYISNKKSTDTYKTNCCQLDDYVDSITSCDLIKIDVEGAECAVLNSAKNMLSKFSPLVIMESHPKQFPEANSILYSCGYEVVARFNCDPHVFAYEKRCQ